MAAKGYLPNMPLVNEDGTWESIVEIVQRQLLPQLGANGEKVFSAPLYSLPPEAEIVPIVSENWSRPRKDGTPQFVYLTEGKNIMMVENKLLSLSKGQGFYLPRGVLYAPYLMLGGRILFCDLIWFKVYPSGLVVLRSRLTPSAHYQSAHFVIVERRLADLFWEWEQERNRPAPNSLLTKGLLVALFGILTRSLPLLPTPLLESDRQQMDLPLPLQLALTTLHRTYNKSFSLSQLASYCGVSPAYLCRLFRRHLSVTPWQYLERLRLEVAAHLLRETNLSITDVAFLSGFNDLHYFSRRFSRFYGVTPSKIRRKKKVRSTSLFRSWD
ncbi:MAG: helix-turn-helix domain-containing protein [Candidatus Fervidibacter sp.]|uniref:helix-turn-helix domain-containing protein n=1 Tax=Candidatus Fervidibacter sp. TaxID=3100871 RepID=UPI00404B8E5F